MAETLLSVGLDVGTTSTQMILSELVIENRSSGFAVPEMEIGQRKIQYKSAVHFTPLLDENHVDGDGLRRIVEEEYRKAGISRQQVDTGAIIITGETGRKENAKAALEALSAFAGEFVVATAGPHLESVLAAKGAGAAEFSAETGKTLLHMDIGGGTANLALIRDGKIVDTDCMNVGGRLLKFNESGKITYVSPVLRDICDMKAGQTPTSEQVDALACLLAQVLEMAAGRREKSPLLDKMRTRESTPMEETVPENAVISFSGGVADCIREDVPRLRFGDMGPALGRAIRKSRLCGGEYRLGEEPIRATVIGAGCHSTQLSGSTVFCQNIRFPLKNVPVICFSPENLEEKLRKELGHQEGFAVIAMAGLPAPDYGQVKALAKSIAAGVGDRAVLLCLQEDMGKALGQALAVELGQEREILCLDRVQVREGSYLDVGEPVGPTFPVVVKTLVLGQ